MYGHEHGKGEQRIGLPEETPNHNFSNQSIPTYVCKRKLPSCERAKEKENKKSKAQSGYVAAAPLRPHPTIAIAVRRNTHLYPPTSIIYYSRTSAVLVLRHSVLLVAPAPVARI